MRTKAQTNDGACRCASSISLPPSSPSLLLTWTPGRVATAMAGRSADERAKTRRAANMFGCLPVGGVVCIGGGGERREIIMFSCFSSQQASRVAGPCGHDQRPSRRDQRKLMKEHGSTPGHGQGRRWHPPRPHGQACPSLHSCCWLLEISRGWGVALCLILCLGRPWPIWGFTTKAFPFSSLYPCQRLYENGNKQARKQNRACF